MGEYPGYPVYTEKVHGLKVLTEHEAKTLAYHALQNLGVHEIVIETIMSHPSGHKLMKFDGKDVAVIKNLPLAAVNYWNLPVGSIKPVWGTDVSAVVQKPGVKSMVGASSKFFTTGHSSHLSDPVGTTDTNCETCMALWDERVRRLHVKYMVALEAEGLDPVTIARAIGVWHIVARQDIE